MKTYKVIFDGYIDVVDLSKMVSNEYGRSAALLKSDVNRMGNTEATIEFDDNIPYEVIELMTDGNVIVQQLVLEDELNLQKSIKEGYYAEISRMTGELTEFITKSDEGEFLSLIILAYMTAHELDFNNAVEILSSNLNKFQEDAFNLYVGQ